MTALFLIVLFAALAAFLYGVNKEIQKNRARALELSKQEEAARTERFLRQQEATFKKDGSYPEPRSSAVYNEEIKIRNLKKRDRETDAEVRASILEALYRNESNN